MGTRSRTPRSGQNCGIGIRTTRSLGTGSTPTSSCSNALISPVSTSPLSHSGFAHKKQAIVSSARRSGGGKAPGKTATSPQHPPLAGASQARPRPEFEEEILAEIVVSTDDLHGLDSMSASYSEMLEAPAAFVGPELDVLQRSHETAPSIVTPTRESIPQPPPSEEPVPIDSSVWDEQGHELLAGDGTSEALAPVQEAMAEPVSQEVTAEETAVKGPSSFLNPGLAEADSAAQYSAVPEPDELMGTVDVGVDAGPLEYGHAVQADFVSSGAAESAVLISLPTGRGISEASPSPLGSASEIATGNTEPPAAELALTEEIIMEDAGVAENIQASHPDGAAPVKETEGSQALTEAPKVESVAAVAAEAQTSCSPPEQSEPMDLGVEAPAPCTIETPRSSDVVPCDYSSEAFESLPHEALEELAQPQKAEITPSKPTRTGMASLEPEFVKSEPVDEALQAIPEASSGPAEIRVNGHQGGYSSAPTSSIANVDQVLDGAADQPSESELSEISTAADPISTEATRPDPLPAKSALSHLIGQFRHSFASSASALTERSGLSSKPSSVSSKATTPLDTDSPREATGQFVPAPTFQTRSAPRIQFKVQPKVSVPADLTPQEYAMECIEAAENSRLNPYALHQNEYHMLRSHISHAQVTTYLNIRNGILRLWVRNPQIAVTREEAIGCAKDTRWFDVANVCFDWLVRRGFINYGCVEIRQAKVTQSTQPQKRRTVAIIGAGFSGLSAARQLEGLFLQYSKRFRDMGEEPPRVIVLEGRNRVGGRVYSRAFQTLPDTAPGVMRGKRFTAEMGGMIITGFDRGNPLNILVRGQLGLPYHCLRSDMSLYDANGTAVDPGRDQLVEQLFNACLDRVSEYKFKTPPSKLIEGNRDLMDEGRDSTAEGHKTIALVEEMTAAQPHAPPVSEQNVAPQVNLVPVSTDRMTGKVHVEPGTPGSTKAAFKAKSLGWTLKAGVSGSRDIELDSAASSAKATLGSVVDEALMQHKDILDLNAQDFRLLNWHIANLEYSNATNLNRLSIKGWDIDAGNEWEGKHTMVVGGYQSVARGIAMLPAPLNILHRAAVKRIKYAPEGSTGPARITLEDGHLIQADYVVNTIPLGVLKHGNIEFQPPLPLWKTEAIQQLGFGVLNKVILVYKEAFWDKDRDIFGMLQTPINRLSLNQKDYAPRRGRFFQWFNVTNTTGMPCLLALMAGDAGYDTEVTPNDELIAEATEVLRMRYGARVTQPLEAIVTRWESDRFARGSYSNAGVNMKAEDYQLMARAIGNLYFAGEHTTVTHPATVHGAYLSGLRAASEVLDAILGPIEIPSPLILPRETTASLKRKAQEENRDPARARLEAYEMEITEHIQSKIGYYPLKPAKIAGNAYLLFNKVYYEEGRKRCEEGRRADKGKPSPNEVRTMTSKMWKEAAPEVRKPFEDQADEQKKVYAQALKEWTEAAARWERDAIALREKYVRDHPSIPGPDEVAVGMSMNGSRRAKRVESYREDDSDVDLE